jgi:DNA-binding FadR family transcriptional regulator
MALADICRNPLFTAVHGAVVEWLIDQRAISGKAATAGEAAYAAHVRIFEAIARHEGAAAQLAMEDHLAAVAELYWRIRATNDTRGA